ncbi:MAG TPA: type II toxin-antitoxin system PemK/MazF family toxin [Pyrinomonadaceae bacterium]|nr:type II toxin-antitoxin system PemK/MazF family toxin [Pyrinomonadaceae bacterium]
MMRGDVYWHKFKEPDKTHPVLIITRDGAISELNTVTVILTTTTIRNVPSQVLLTEEDGVRETCVLNVDWIQTIPINKLGSYVTHLSDERMNEIFEAIKFAFGFDK